MMNIKFIGRVKFNGNYRFSGDLVIGSLIVKSTGVFIYTIELDNFENIIFEGEVEVDEESVCQFTGLHDKNSNEIYEGDIVKHSFYDAVAIIVFDPFLGFYADKWLDDFRNESDCNRWEVIGNIYEKPELLCIK